MLAINLAGGGVVAMRFFAREGIVGDFLEDAFAHADGGNGQAADIEVAAEGDEA